MTLQVFKNLGKFMSYEEKVIAKGRPCKIMIKYTQPNYQDISKVWEVGVFEDQASEELLEKIASLSSGELICVHTKKNEKGYSDLHDITDAGDAPGVATATKSRYKSNNSSYVKPSDQGDGAQVGNALTNAVGILGPGHTVEELESTAWEIILAGERLKLKLQAKRTAKEATVSKTEIAKKEEEVQAPISKISQLRAKKKVEEVHTDLEFDDDDDDLDGINFEE